MRGLLRRHDDVFIVGQHEHGFRRHRVHRAHDIVGRGVHGLAALHDHVHAQVGEHIFQAVARRDRDKAVLFLRRGDHALGRRVRRTLDHLGGVLLAHILDFDREQRAEFQPFLQRPVRLVGMHMHLNDVVVLHHDQRIPDIAQDRAQAADIAGLVLARGNELGAVGERDLLVRNGGEVRGGLRRRLCGRALLADAAQPVQHALQDGQEAERARVHHARLFQHGVLVYGFRKRLPPAFEHRAKHLLRGQRRIGLTGLDRVLGGYARHSQDRPLGRLHDRLVGGVHALAQRERQRAPVRLLRLAQLFRHAAEQQRQDNARIAARAAQQRGGGRVRGLCQRRLFQFVQLGHGGRHGHGHIGACIAVRHGEHVQLIGALLVFRNGERALDHHGFEKRAVYFLICHMHTLPNLCFQAASARRERRRHGIRGPAAPVHQSARMLST